MRKVLGWVLVPLGVLVLLAGAVAAVFVGPDDTVTFTEDHISTEAPAVVTSPGLLTVTGPTIHATADTGAEVFVGAAHPVHVDAYLDDVPHERISKVSLSGLSAELSFTAQEGDEQAPAAEPAGLDWWAAESVGSGEQSVSAELTEDPVSLVIMNADMSAPLEVDLTVDVTLDRLFTTALLVVAAGLIMIVGGFFLIRSGRGRRPNEDQGATVYTEDAAISTEDGATERTAQARPEKLHRTAQLSLFTIGALVIAGCAQIPDQVERTDAYTVPASTTEQVQEFFTHYTEVNNTANAELDDELAESIETGTVLRTTKFGYEADRDLDAGTIDPFDVVPTSAATPELDSYPLWYLATADWEFAEPADEQEAEEAESQGATNQSRYYLVTRNNPTSPWRVAHSVGIPPEVDVPTPVVENGTAQQAEPSEDVVEAVLSDLVDLAETGDEPDNIDSGNAAGLGTLHEYAFTIQNLGDSGTDSFQCDVDNDDELHWLATDAGALTVASISCTWSIDMRPGSTWNADDSYLTLPGGVDFTSTTISSAASFVLEIPDDESETPTVAGTSRSVTEIDYQES